MVGPMRVCASCRGLIPQGGKCAPCAKANQQTYDTRRGSRQERGYDDAWYRWRRQVMQDHDLSLCGDRPVGAPATDDSKCQREGRYQIGNDLDHIVPIAGKEDPRRLDVTNVQLLCDAFPNYCHSRKRGRESAEVRNVLQPKGLAGVGPR